MLRSHTCSQVLSVTLCLRGESVLEPPIPAFDARKTALLN